MQYTFVAEASAAEYQGLLLKGWRRFGRAFFRPVCADCKECRSVRVPIDGFQPDRSQRRTWKANADIELRIGEPSVTKEKLSLHDRFHSFQSDDKGWTRHDPKDPAGYAETFLNNPFPTEEWQYFLNDRLIAVGYVDVLPEALSAIYFFYEPEERGRSLGTFNVLKVMDRAATMGIPHVYLGYYVEGCRSLEYKGRFRPNEELRPGGEWVPFRRE